MRIAIIGYGRMGKMIQKEIEASGSNQISAIIDPYAEGATHRALTKEALQNSDAAIDFSAASTTLENIKIYSESGIPAVIGTTGWLNNLAEAERVVSENNAKLIYSGNFSIGVAVFLHLAEAAGRIINNISSYDVSVSEVHHREKADAPSGTALMVAEKLLSTVDRKTGLQIGNPEGKIGKELINVASMRVGSVPGIHTITLDSAADTIEIRHTARSREGFAEGAVKAAAWLIKQNPGIYTMDDFVSALIGGQNA